MRNVQLQYDISPLDVANFFTMYLKRVLTMTSYNNYSTCLFFVCQKTRFFNLTFSRIDLILATLIYLHIYNCLNKTSFILASDKLCLKKQNM